MIVEHEIAPGEHIGIDAVAQLLGVSPTPVREALARLEEADLVIKEPLKGYSATKLLSRKEFDDLFRFRALVEPWVASLAAEQHAGKEALSEELERARELQSSGEASTYGDMADHDSRFHELIATLSGNATASKALAGTHCHLHLYRLYMATREPSLFTRDSQFVASLFSEYYDPKTGIRALREHELIAEAILAGDSGLAADRALEHIESSRAQFEQVVDALRHD